MTPEEWAYIEGLRTGRNKARHELKQRNEIAQAIRNAAIYGAHNLGSLESLIVDCFYDNHYGNGACGIVSALLHPNIPSSTKERYRMFLLIVAEALS